MTRSLLFFVPLLCACAARTPPAEGRVDSWTHPDYAELRPVVVAVLPGRGEARRIGVRNHVYEGLVAKRYSPLKLEAVDARVDADGRFMAKDIDWDARMVIEVTSWRAYRDGLFRANGTATLIHRTGEKIWSCTLNDYPLAADTQESSARLARVYLDHLPPSPPLR